MHKSENVTLIQLKTPLLIAAPESLRVRKVKSHLHDYLDLTDDENPARNIPVRCRDINCSTSRTCVAPLFLVQTPGLQLEPVLTGLYLGHFTPLSTLHFE